MDDSAGWAVVGGAPVSIGAQGNGLAHDGQVVNSSASEQKMVRGQLGEKKLFGQG